MWNIKKKLGRAIGREESGFTLLEYVAGASVMLGVVFLAFSGMADQVQLFFNELATWAGNRITDLQQAP